MLPIDGGSGQFEHGFTSQKQSPERRNIRTVQKLDILGILLLLLKVQFLKVCRFFSYLFVLGQYLMLYIIEQPILVDKLWFSQSRRSCSHFHQQGRFFPAKLK